MKIFAKNIMINAKLVILSILSFELLLIKYNYIHGLLKGVQENGI